MNHHDLVVMVAALAAVAAAGISLSAGLALSRRSLRHQLSALAEVLGENDSGSLEDLLRSLQRSASAAVLKRSTSPTQIVPPAPIAPPGRMVPPVPTTNQAGPSAPVIATGRLVPPVPATNELAPTSTDRATLRQVLDALPQGVIISAPGAELKVRNARARSLLDGQSEVLAARAVDDLLERSADGTPAERTIELYGPPRRTLTVRTVPMRDANGSLSVLAVIEDVSELRRLEAVRSDFVANMSHELKTPAGALGLLAETLTDEEDPLVARHLADRIQAEAFRLNRIIDDLLDLSRIEAASEVQPREPVELKPVLTEALDGVRTMAQARTVGLVLTEPERPLVVLGDRRQLVSALHNLLANAVKFTEGGTDVTLSATATADGVSVDTVVCDHGMGIPTSDLERVFERFYRVDHGRGRDSGGTGLGLAIVRHVANNHGGRVWVESREGEGSSFTLRLPLACAAVPAELSQP